MIYKTKSGCRFGEKCSYAHRQVDEQPTKRSKKNNDKSAVAMLKKGDWHERGPVTDQSHDRSGKPDKRSDKKLGQKSSQRQLSDARQLGCVFQDMKPPKSILRKSTDMPKTIQRVKFKKAIARHTKIRDQNPSLGYICPGEPHERCPNAPKFEDRSQEETEWQEQGAREDLDPGGMPSRKNKPPDIWDTHGKWRNVFVNPPSSSSPYPGGFNPWILNVTEHISPHVTSERQNPDTTLDPICQSGPSARNSFDPSDGADSS